MGLLDNGFKGNIIGGLAIGLGAAVLAPALLPVLAGVMKPVAKAAIKGGILLYEKSKEEIAEFSEMVEDIVAEAKAEVAAIHEEVVSGGEGETEA